MLGGMGSVGVLGKLRRTRGEGAEDGGAGRVIGKMSILLLVIAFLYLFLMEGRFR